MSRSRKTAAPEKTPSLPDGPLGPSPESTTGRLRRFYVLSVIDVREHDNTTLDEHLETCRQLGTGEIIGGEYLPKGVESLQGVPFGEKGTRELVQRVAHRVADFEAGSR